MFRTSWSVRNHKKSDCNEVISCQLVFGIPMEVPEIILPCKEIRPNTQLYVVVLYN